MVWEVWHHHLWHWVSLLPLDHSIFVRYTKSGLVILAVYIDDILLTESDSAGIVKTKEYCVTSSLLSSLHMFSSYESQMTLSSIKILHIAIHYIRACSWRHWDGKKSPTIQHFENDSNQLQNDWKMAENKLCIVNESGCWESGRFYWSWMRVNLLLRFGSTEFVRIRVCIGLDRVGWFKTWVGWATKPDKKRSDLDCIGFQI